MDGALPNLPGPLPTPARLPRVPVVPSAVLGTLFVAVAETMFFAGMISALTISRANQLPGMWPPPGQPRLPVSATGLNTGLLLLSGVLLLVANWQWRRRLNVARVAYAASWVLGALFVGLQGREWQALLAQGLTVTSSTLGSFFYMIVGAHALHAVGALVALGWGGYKLLRGTLTPGFFFGSQTFWYFVVLMWPVIYARVYF
jgi:heme/copper-type cytochrome/quinol oxidase subunit 3